MKANELMIGDWIYNTQNQQNEQVQEIGSGLVMLDHDYLYGFDEILPIPLTMEILEKNGINKEMDSSLVFSEDVNRYLVLISNCGKLFWQYNLVAINYVHELQHALRLCGIEKEIEL